MIDLSIIDWSLNALNAKESAFHSGFILHTLEVSDFPIYINPNKTQRKITIGLEEMSNPEYTHKQNLFTSN